VADALLDILRRQIRLTGPLSVADYMTLCLHHPVHGYYRVRPAVGRGGDFVTAPEVSQMFGELLGLWCADHWQRRGGGPAALVELGPGRGTLMADALRATRTLPGFHDALSVHLVDGSEALKHVQAETLYAYGPTWHLDLSTLPTDRTLLVLANEFFDALPVRQYVRLDDGWHERRVGLDDQDRLAWQMGREPSPLLLPAPDLPVDAVLEQSAPSVALMGDLAQRLAAQGGAALIVDYGHPAPTGAPSFQAVRAHRMADALSDPGETDLTAHVDFGALATTARAAGLATAGPEDQGAFLMALGLMQRAESLARGGADVPTLNAAIARLTAPDQMGTLFKAIALSDRPDLGFPGFQAISGPAPSA